MPSTTIVTLERTHSSEYYVNFVIRGSKLELDWISIELKTKGKHRDKACWSSATQYRGRSIGDWLFRLQNFGFDTAEFEQACIEMGWEKEVRDYRKG